MLTGQCADCLEVSGIGAPRGLEASRWALAGLVSIAMLL
jgi:hypothetical protein